MWCHSWIIIIIIIIITTVAHFSGSLAPDSEHASGAQANGESKCMSRRLEVLAYLLSTLFIALFNYIVTTSAKTIMQKPAGRGEQAFMAS